MARGQRSRIKKSLGDQIVDVIIYIVLGAIGISTLLPFVYVMAGSMATEKELTEKAFFIFPEVISFEAYRYIYRSGDVFRGMRNSLYLTAVGTMINMIATTVFAYPLSKRYLKGRNFIMNMVIVTMLFGAGMIPNYIWLNNILRMGNTYWVLMIPGAVSAFNMIIIKNFFQDLPQELDEAARIDGCRDFKIFYKIVLPLSKPVIASISLFYAVGHWNDYFSAMMYISDPKKEVIQIVLRRIIFLTSNIVGGIEYETVAKPPDRAVKMAVTVVATVPILLVYPFVQKYFTKGVMVGAIKG